MEQYVIKARTYAALGLKNICLVAFYLLGIKTGLNPIRRLTAVLPSGPFFGPISKPVNHSPSSAWKQIANYFSSYKVPCTECPDWHVNPLTGNRVKHFQNPWWEIPDFDPEIGDIKAVWEASRFDWVVAMAQRVACGDDGELQRLNRWLTDWCEKNPAYYGPNWKCGQEASIRIMHMAMAAVMLGQVRVPKSSLIAFVRVHLGRILPTVAYAVAQNNNHGTSEAVGLFIGGSWLALTGSDKFGERCLRIGRKLLENRVRFLIEPDGSFSQYSVTYHRVLLDTMCMIEIWRGILELPRFSDSFYDRCRAATKWLYTFVQPETGDAPNIGANDGARLLSLSDTDYRDFRPTVQLAAALFCGAKAYENAGNHDVALKWFEIEPPSRFLPAAQSRFFDDGGYIFLIKGTARVYLRYPRFRFRPSHADALHLDLWLAGKNILRDGGSYSYGADAGLLDYFQGTRSHNTVQFDNRDQMPRISRFLFGDWLKTDYVIKIHNQGGEVKAGAAYTDRSGRTHQRKIILSNTSLIVEDSIDGSFRLAVLRWRLCPAPWQLHENMITNKNITLKIITDLKPVRITLEDGWECRYYLRKTILPVLEVEVDRPSKIITEVGW